MAKGFFNWYLKHAFGWLFHGNDAEDIIMNLINPFKASSNVLSSNDPLDLEKGLFSDNGLFGSSSGSGDSAIERFLNAIANRVTAEHLTGAEKEANVWSAEQATTAYNRQREFYQDFQSPSAMVRQYQEAGLNPALMLGNGAPSSGVISSASPQSVSPQGSNLDPVSMIASIASLGLRASEVHAENKLKAANAYYLSQQGDMIAKQNRIFDDKWSLEREILSKRVENIGADTKVKLAQESNLLQGINESEAREKVAIADAALKNVDLKTRSMYNQACLELVKSERSLNIAKTNFEYTASSKTEAERKYMQQKIDYFQEEFDKNMEHLDAIINKMKSEKQLTDKEVQFFENKYNLQVAATCNGAVMAAKFQPGTRFQSGAYGFTSYLGDMGKVAKNVGNNFLK